MQSANNFVTHSGSLNHLRQSLFVFLPTSFLRTAKLISFRRKSFLLGCRRLSTFSIIDFFPFLNLKNRVSGFASPGNGNGRSRFPFSLQRSNVVRFQSLRRRQKWVPSERTKKRRRLELPPKKIFCRWQNKQLRLSIIFQ